MSDETNLRSRNARLRGKIEQFLEGADASVQDAVQRIALEQLPAVSDDTAESLRNIHNNLQRRADALIRAGVAKKEDFEGI